LPEVGGPAIVHVYMQSSISNSVFRLAARRTICPQGPHSWNPRW
jgi:hypothetical protein